MSAKRIFITNIDALSKRNRRERIKEIEEKLIRRALLEEYAISDADISTRCGYRGKPYFLHIDLFFNISHSGSIISCAIDEDEIGLDVQEIRDISDKVMQRLFDRSVTGSSEKTYMWTKYESYAKLLGCGIPLDGRDYMSGFYTSSHEIDGYIITIAQHRPKYKSLKIVSV